MQRILLYGESGALLSYLGGEEYLSKKDGPGS